MQDGLIFYCRLGMTAFGDSPKQLNYVVGRLVAVIVF